MLHHRHGLPCEHGYIHAQIRCLEQVDIGGNAIALGQQNQVADHQLPAGDAFLPAVPDDQGARTGQLS